MADYHVITPDFVKLHISTSKDDISFNEKRFPKNLTIADLKAKLELVTGGNCQTMKVEVYDKSDKYICTLDNDESMLGTYPVDENMRIHVIDNFCIRNELDSGGDIEKFEMPDEEYAKKTDTVRAFLMKNKLGQYNEENKKKKEKIESEEKKLIESMPIGSRCKVAVTNAPCRLGTIMYTGTVESLSGYWIGVKYDEPLGKHNGTFKDKKYFECPNNYGAFVKPNYVECGKFPVEDYNLNEEI